MLFILSWLLLVSTVIGHIQRCEKIINGFDASIENFPYQAALLYNDELLCGGSIISKNIILTAAHCVIERIRIYFKVGVGSIYFKRSIKFSLSRIVIHPGYNRNSYIYDIAILKLEKPLTFSKNVKPIEIQPINSEVFDSSKAYVSGWGITKVYIFESQVEPNALSVAKRLQAAEVQIISNEKCKNTNKIDRLILTYHYLCAIDKYQGACLGDSGGPLVANNKLIGIVSFGVRNCDPPNPGIYVNVSYVRAFIDLYL